MYDEDPLNESGLVMKDEEKLNDWELRGRRNQN